MNKYMHFMEAVVLGITIIMVSALIVGLIVGVILSIMIWHKIALYIIGLWLVVSLTIYISLFRKK